MRILMIAARDSTNFAMSKIAKEFEKRGHEVLIYDKNLNSVNIRMFAQMGLKVHYYDELTDEIVNSCDIMFAHTTYVRDRKISKKLYTFFFNHIFVYGHENASDFVFTQCDDPYNTFPNKVVMKIGSPKMDRGHSELIPADESKRILFIETGHFPFGKKGRMQVAKLILAICEKCKDYTITVKPCFLLEDTKCVTRKNIDHIYRYLYKLCENKLPDNLELLMEHHDLDEYIYQSHSIVCYGSSSYLEASLSGRGVLYVDGIESLDAIGDRQNKYWKAFREFIEDSGIVVPYDKALDYLPDGILCSEKHLSKVLYSKEDTVPRMVDVVEHIWNQYLSKGIYPAVGHYEYNDYQKNMKCDPSMTAQRLEENNVYDVLCYEIQKADQSTGAEISFDTLKKQIRVWKNNRKLNEENKKSLIKKLDQMIQENYVVHKEEMMKNKIDQSILMKAYNKLKLFGDLERLYSENLLAKDAFYYYMGRHYCNQDDERGVEYWEKYINFLKNTTFEESDIYFTEAIIDYFNCLYLYYSRQENVERQKECLKQVDELSYVYQYIVVNYDVRCARLCKKAGLDDAMELLIHHWFEREHSEIQRYRELEINAEVYGFLAELYEKRGLSNEALKAREESKKNHKEKMQMIGGL